MIDLSVIIPTYNSGALLGEAVRSIGDPGPTGEILIVDDGSTDGSVAQVADHPGVRVLSQANGGPGAARNRAIAAARGNLIAFLDADDIWLPGRTTALLTAARSPAADLLYADYRVRNLTTGGVRDVVCPGFPEPAAAALFRHNLLCTSAVAARRTAIVEAGGFRSDLRFGEDWDLWLRLTEAGTIAKLPGYASEYRERPGSLAGAGVDAVHAASEKVLAAALARRPDLYRPVARLAVADLALRSGIRAYKAHDFSRARRYFLRAMAGGRLTPSARFLVQSLR
jgi:glycosyltransferase involved in cell wall biosynthesis